MARRSFGKEFKVEAVRLVRDRGVSIAHASRDLDVHENVGREHLQADLDAFDFRHNRCKMNGVGRVAARIIGRPAARGPMTRRDWPAKPCPAEFSGAKGTGGMELTMSLSRRDDVGLILDRGLAGDISPSEQESDRNWSFKWR